MTSTAKTFKKVTQGFTLIELLVVIAVIGVLAGAIIVAVNPTEQLKRARDTQRKSSVSQLANAVSAYYTSKNGVYPTESITWITQLSTSGEIKAIPAAVSGAACTNATGIQNDFCYDLATATDYTVFTKLESIADNSKCSAEAAGATVAYFLFSSAQAKAGVVCGPTTDPVYTATFSFK